ncbi:MAG TPA: hypothetical protein VGM77_07070 [Gemmatimonadales bacterium]
MRVLLNELGGGRDGILDVGEQPHRLADADVDIACKLIDGTAGCRLPIVYISAGFNGQYVVNPDSLGSELAGMAHVVVEPNRPFSMRLKLGVGAENVYGGTIGIYWPDGGGRRSFFLGREFDSGDEIATAIFEEVRTALNNRRPLPRCTYSAVQELSSRLAFDALRAAGSQEVDKYASEFDQEMRAKDEQLAEAEREIERLKAEVRKYEARSPMGSGISLRVGQEQDLFPGELGGVLYDAIADAATRVTKDSRRENVLAAILANNPQTSEAPLMKEELKRILRSARTVDAGVRHSLERMGFVITEEGKHFKLVFAGDDRYTFTLPKSGSDVRGGLNAASDISRLLL